MFVWGSTVHGELGLGGIEDEQIYEPRLLEWFAADLVKEAACSLNHSLLLTNDGKVYSCGNNDFGQLGHNQPRKRPHNVSDLDAYRITHVACGLKHSMALNQWGQVFTWGCNAEGQLGNQLEEQIQHTPKILKALTVEHVIQIASGKSHSLALTTGGKIYVWGANSYGQLGLGQVTNFEAKPAVVSSLAGMPIAFIACGQNHTFALSTSGAVYAWGKNSHGQLGLNDTETRSFPTQLRMLRNVRVKYISCGDEFSTFLTSDGGVFTCGAGMYGQLGHGSTGNETLPRKIVELMGSTITQIMCGSRHTLALVPSRGRVYSFGLGSSGQLGLSKSTNHAAIPQTVHGPWGSSSGSSVIGHSKSEFVVQRIFTGGDHCFATVTKTSKLHPPFDSRVYKPESKMLVLDYKYLHACLHISTNQSVDQEILAYIETVFKSLSCINGSFLMINEDHYCCSSNSHGIDMGIAEKTFSLIGKFDNQNIKDLIWNCITEDLLKTLSPQPPDVETLRIYLILPFYHEFNNPRQYVKLQAVFAKALLSLKPPATRVINKWLSTTTSNYFEKLVSNYKNVVHFIIRNQKLEKRETIHGDPNLKVSLDMLMLLHKLNHRPQGNIVPYDTFYLPELAECVDVRVDYLLWLSESSPNVLFLCNFPFLFDANAKMRLLQTDQSIQMRSAMNEAAHRTMLTMLLQPNMVPTENHLLKLNVTRDKIASDAIEQLQSVEDNDLKKPLVVKFWDEEAEDGGGVKKEFFLLVLREILDPKYGMFRSYEEGTHVLWFSELGLESDDKYALIGIICGLAIYNFIIIDLPFPQALYKKILREPVTLADLKDLSPTVAESLNAILEYEGDEFEETFCISFQITYDMLGDNVTVELKPDGGSIAVTQENHGIKCAGLSKEMADAAATNLDWICNTCKESNPSLRDVFGILKAIQGNQEELKQSVMTCQSAITECKTSMSNLSSLIGLQDNKITECLEKLETLQLKCVNLEKENVSLKARMNESEQYSRTNCVEIHGIPNIPGENILTTMHHIGAAVGFKLEATMMDACHRLSRVDSGSTPNSSPIIAKFVRRFDKENFMRCRRIKSNLSTRHLDQSVSQLARENTPIYFNDCLSQYYREIWFQARQFRKANNIKFLWTRNGKIFMRKKEGSGIFRINKLEDLNSVH